MKALDVMRRSVVSLPQNATLQDVLSKFQKHRLDSLPIVDAAQRVVGFITIDDLIDIFLPRYHELLRDFAALEDKGQLVSLFDRSFTGLDLTEGKLILAADLMNTHLHWVHSDTSLIEAAALLQSQNLQYLPVVDRDRHLVGLISDFEVVLALLRGSTAETAITPA
jgi:CBS domain-containing membrane protein